MRIRWLGLLLLLAVTAATAGHAVAAPPAPVTEFGYITVADGTQLRYTVTRPGGSGRFPVAMDYDGYCEGIGASNCNDPSLAGDLLAAGYAVLGVSVRGTGCSTGTFDFRSPEESTDGAAAVTWAARQPWSTGKIGMFGDSFPGLTQPGIAALRPQGLAAIAPFQIVDDVYRDVGNPGGIENTEFGAFWGLADQPVSGAENPPHALLEQGDAQCETNYAGHEPANTQHNILLAGRQHPFHDAYWQSKAIGASAARIDVPVLGCVTWQDDEVGSRPANTFFRHVDPAKLWLVASNGEHGMCDAGNPTMNKQVVRFFDRFVRGLRNGFDRMPRVQIWHEASAAYTTDVQPPGRITVTSASKPSWITTFSSWPPATHTTPLYLRTGGALGPDAPRRGEAAETYQAPAPSAGTEDGVVAGQHNLLWTAPVPPGGALAWTTPPLKKDVETLGPASADLWLTSTGIDTDLQVTVTEVRPDGQETYVARGWLRASHRRLDAAESTATSPVPTHAAADAQPLVPGQPSLVRIEVMPFDHVFRAGSSIRLIVDTPSQTGGWNFEVLTTPVTNAVLHDAAHPSRLVLGVLPGGHALKPLPGCNTLLNQPCRTSTYPVPGRS